MAERGKKQFAAILDKAATPTPNPGKGSTENSRGKHIGGYFNPAVAKQLKGIALEEDKTAQELVAEALDLLFQTRGKPTIAGQS